MAIYHSNRAGQFQVSSILDIKSIEANYLREFHILEIAHNHVLVYHKADPAGVSIGEVYGLPDGYVVL